MLSAAARTRLKAKTSAARQSGTAKQGAGFCRLSKQYQPPRNNVQTTMSSTQCQSSMLTNKKSA